jgi:hypothetical protein
MLGANKWIASVAFGLPLLGCRGIIGASLTDAGGDGLGPPVTPVATAASTQAEAHCATGEVAVVLDAGYETCVVECRSHANCPAGWSCDGAGMVVGDGGAGTSVKFCTAHPGQRSETPAASGGAPPRHPVAALEIGTETAPMHAPFCRGDRGGPRRQCTNGLCRLECKTDYDCGLSPAHCQNGVCEAPTLKPCGR